MFFTQEERVTHAHSLFHLPGHLCHRSLLNSCGQSHREKTCPCVNFSAKNPYEYISAPTRVSAVRSRRLTACAVEQPSSNLLSCLQVYGLRSLSIEGEHSRFFFLSFHSYNKMFILMKILVN